MPNTYSSPESVYTDMDSESETITLLPPGLWSIAYLDRPGILEAASRQDPQRVGEIFNLESNKSSASSSAGNSDTHTKQFSSSFRPSAPQMSLYDGSASGLRAFCSQLVNQLQDQSECFPNELSKVRFAYQCLGQDALMKMRSSFRCLEDPTVPPEIKTLKQFLSALKQRCQDPAREDQASHIVENLYQKNMKFHEFITIFEDNMADSTYGDLDKSHWKKMLQRRLSKELRTLLNGASDCPSDYHDFVNYLRGKDATIQSIRATYPQSSLPSTNRIPIAPFPPIPPPQVPVSRNLTVSQGGSAMDLDVLSREKGPDGRLTSQAKNARHALGRCLWCNKSGHMAISCPLSSHRLASASVESPSNQEDLKEVIQH